MGRTKNTIWAYFNNRPSGYSCKYCNFQYKVKNATKMAKHISKCSKCPVEVQRLVVSNNNKASSSSPSIVSVSHSQLQEENEDEPQIISRNTTVPLWKPPSRTASTSSITSYFDVMHLNEQKTANEMLARAIYVSGVPLSIVEHPLWIAYFKYLRPANNVPRREAVSTGLLNDEYARVKSELSVMLADSKNLNLQCDGWSNIRNEGILNFIVTTPKPVFVDFVNTKENRHTGDYLADEMEKVMEKYGLEKFFVVIGDNAANVKKALFTLETRHPHIVPLGCLAHTLHLICNDIVNTTSVNSFVQKVVTIVKTVRQSQVLTALFIKINKEKGSQLTLHLPVKTRWGSYLNCLTSMVSCKVTLQTLAVHQDASATLPKDLKLQILDDEIFWIRISKLINVFQPIVSWITTLEGDKPLIHKAFTAFDEIQIAVSEAVPHSLLTKSEEKKILEKITSRKDFAIAPIHLAAALLNPSSQGHLLSQTQQHDAIEFIDKTANFMNEVDTENLMVDLANYRARDGMWSKEFVWKSVDKMSPITWWKCMFGSTDLSKVAVRILSAPVTSAATERSFSTFSRIHTKRRNRLTTERAGRITFIAHNWSLMNIASQDEALVGATLNSPGPSTSRCSQDELVEPASSNSNEEGSSSDDDVEIIEREDSSLDSQTDDDGGDDDD